MREDAAHEDRDDHVREGRGHLGPYTRDEVTTAVKRSTGLFRACYQKELNRAPQLAGTLAFKVAIGDDGRVGAVDRTLDLVRSHGVESCVSTFLHKLRFPPRGVAEIVVPMVFTAHKP